MKYFSGIYQLQRLALYPFTRSFEPAILHATLAAMDQPNRDTFFRFLCDNTLGPVWYDRLGKEATGTIWSKKQAQLLQHSAFHATAQYLRQQVAIAEFTKELDNWKIPHAIFKGAHTREIAYAHPAMRPSCDIDLLIHQDQRPKTIEIFQNLGYTLHTLDCNLTHEVSLHRGSVAIDLHWHILRPGRIPLSFTDELLASRILHNGQWGVGNEENLCILLVHPVISKYSLMTRHGLIRMVDLLLWLATQPVDGHRLHQLLDHIGLRTAAWISLSYLHLFTDDQDIDNLAENLTPGRLQRTYLQLWLKNDLATRLLDHQLAVKLGFTLFAHDNLHHASRFLKTHFLSGKTEGKRAKE